MNRLKYSSTFCDEIVPIWYRLRVGTKSVEFRFKMFDGTTLSHSLPLSLSLSPVYVTKFYRFVTILHEVERVLCLRNTFIQYNMICHFDCDVIVTAS